jgi:hypothetical protein
MMNKPQFYYGQYYKVETTYGDEIIPVAVVTKKINRAADLEFYTDGSVYDQEIVMQFGWLGGLSAINSHEWKVYPTEHEAEDAIIDEFGSEDWLESWDFDEEDSFNESDDDWEDWEDDDLDDDFEDAIDTEGFSLD